MKKNIFYLIILLITLTACSSNTQKGKDGASLKISTNSWIGYAPLFYAKEKGYLKKLNIQLVLNVSLGEAADTYLVNDADMVTTTQHELHEIQKTAKDTVPIILLDRSNGGDMILSNKSLQQIKNAKEIDAYLEINSINTNLLRDFIHFNKLNENKFHFINKDQAEIQDIKPQSTKTILIVSYSPYDVKLKKNGFHTISSTKDMKELIVIDALCTHKEFLQTKHKQLKKLKKIIDISIEKIQSDKKSSYKLIKKYLQNITYKEYLNALNGIKWINHPSSELLKRIEPIGYKREYLIQ
jgi:NitT/TauT family transport system substrate-binding protein